MSHFFGAIRFFRIILSALVLAGCSSSLEFADIRPGIESRGHYIENVPFFRQAEDDCGPAALATVLAYHGKTANRADITRAIYTPKLRGTLPMDMERYAKEQGFFVESMKGSLALLKSNIGRNAPVVVLLDLGFGPYRRPHYVTVTGYDDIRRVVIMHDGRTQNRVVDYDSFERMWARAGNWMLVVRPGEKEQ